MQSGSHTTSRHWSDVTGRGGGVSSALARVVAYYPLVAATALVFLPDFDQRVGPLALATILVPYLAIAALLLAPVAIVRPVPPLRAGLVLLALAMVLGLGREWFSLPTEVPTGDLLRTATWNLELDARSGEDAVRGIRDLDVDVIALQELGPEHVQAINSASDMTDRYPARELRPDQGVLGIGLLSRYPIVRVGHYSQPSTIEAVLDVDGHQVTVITAHPLPGSISMVGPLPVSFDARRRDVDLRRVRTVAAEAIRRGETVVILGDFNVAPTEPGYKDLVGGLHDAHAEVGEGPGWTWRPSRFEWTGLGLLRIDLALSGPGARPVSVGERCGLPGDHCQLEASFHLEPMPQGPGPFFVLLPGHDTVKPLPMTVKDSTGLLAGASAAVEQSASDGVEAVPGQPKRIRVTWIGGACDRTATMQMSSNGAGIQLTVETFVPGGSCLLIGIGRSVELELLTPFDPRSITVVSKQVTE